MVRVFFMFVGEGQSDSVLTHPLSNLCEHCGADEVQVVAPNLAALPKKVGPTVRDKLQAALRLEPNVNLIFVHRDADNVGVAHRVQEIRLAMSSLSCNKPYVPVVPIQATEAWLLLDEPRIRRAADNPGGRIALDIPRPGQVESLSRPKERLWELLRTASEQSGRRLDKFNKTLERRRRLLLERLDIHGPIREVPAWQQLTEELRVALHSIAQEPGVSTESD